MKKIVIFLIVLFIILITVSVVLTLVQKHIPFGGKVGLIKIEGPILDNADTIEELKNHRKDSSIKVIVLRINSPGGAVVPSQEIYEEIKKTVDTKKVVVSMGSLAASGGYYIASPASLIVANPGSITGSIGVIMEIPNIKVLMNKIGIKTEVIKSGKHKDLASIFRDIRDEEKTILQGVLDDVHEQFIKAVADGRNISIEEVRKIADGRIFTGSQAMEIGLVDMIGNLQDAIMEASRIAGIKGEPQVVEKKREFSFFELLENSFFKYISSLVPPVKLKYEFNLD